MTPDQVSRIRCMASDAEWAPDDDGLVSSGRMGLIKETVQEPMVRLQVTKDPESCTRRGRHLKVVAVTRGVRPPRRLNAFGSGHLRDRPGKPEQLQMQRNFR